MGLLGLFGGNRKAEQAQKALEERCASHPGPRAQHFGFAHTEMPALVHEFGLTFMLRLGGQQSADELLRKIWDDTGADLPPEELASFEELTYFTCPHERYRILIIVMPPAVGVGEAHFTATVCGPMPIEPSPEAEDAELEYYEEGLRRVVAEYFTLDVAVDMTTGDLWTVFGSWDKYAHHTDLDYGCEPTVDAFYAHVVEHLRRRK